MRLRLDESETAPASDDEEPEPAPARSGPRVGLLTLTLVAVLALLLGVAGGWLIPRLATPGENSVEAGFARDMTTHHAQAVEMGLIAYDRAVNPSVRTIGYDIATMQQGEIGTMQTWLRMWHLDPTGSEPAMAWMPGGTETMVNGLMPGMATPEQMAQLRNAQGTALDQLFIKLMIDHHLGAIHMVDAVLAESDVDVVREVAQRMKNTQQAELNNLRARAS